MADRPGLSRELEVVEPRAATVGATATVDCAAAGDVDLTCTDNTVITPSGTPNGRTITLTCLASGGARSPSMASTVALTTGKTGRALNIPSGGKGVFLLRYSSLGTASWYLADAFLVV